MLLGGAVKAGRLDRRVAIDRNYPTQDSSGDPVSDWQPLATVWAAIAPQNGREGDLDRDIRAEVDTVIRVRYSPLTAALTAVDRLRYRDRIYNIVSAVDVDTRHVEMLIEAKSGLNDG